MEPLAILAVSSTVYALFSEIVGMNPKWKSNSVVQLILSVGKAVLNKK